jgi:ABC-type branched-subunit amino acid transport system substrate-binding protein
VIGGDSIKVALLVPLSGRASGVGLALRNAAEMALFDVSDDRFALAIHDTGSTSPGAVAAARLAIDDGAEMLIGPLFGGSAAQVAPIAQSAGVPVLSFSNDMTVAGNGVWVFGLLPEDQVRRVVSYSAAGGNQEFAAFLPATAYGEIVRTSLIDATARAGLGVPTIGQYSPGADTTELSDIVKQFTRTLPGAFKSKSTPSAVLVPDGGAALRSIAPLLAYYDVDSDTSQLLGSALWSDPSIGRENTLVGGLFAAPSPALRQSFEERYRRFHGEHPPGLASLGYDAVSMAAALARQPVGVGASSPFDRVALTQPSGFFGADGIFRLLPDGGNERGLAVLRVTADGFEIQDPAPQSFEALIN